MKHICETIRDYIDAMNTSMQGDTIFCTEELWNQIHYVKSQPERLNPEDHIADAGKMVCDSLNTANKKRQ